MAAAGAGGGVPASADGEDLEFFVPFDGLGGLDQSPNFDKYHGVDDKTRYGISLAVNHNELFPHKLREIYIYLLDDDNRLGRKRNSRGHGVGSINITILVDIQDQEKPRDQIGTSIVLYNDNPIIIKVTGVRKTLLKLLSDKTQTKCLTFNEITLTHKSNTYSITPTEAGPDDLCVFKKSYVEITDGTPHFIPKAMQVTSTNQINNLKKVAAEIGKISEEALEALSKAEEKFKDAQTASKRKSASISLKEMVATAKAAINEAKSAKQIAGYSLEHAKNAKALCEIALYLATQAAEEVDKQDSTGAGGKVKPTLKIRQNVLGGGKRQTRKKHRKTRRRRTSRR